MRETGQRVRRQGRQKRGGATRQWGACVRLGPMTAALRTIVPGLGPGLTRHLASSLQGSAEVTLASQDRRLASPEATGSK